MFWASIIVVGVTWCACAAYVIEQFRHDALVDRVADLERLLGKGEK